MASQMYMKSIFNNAASAGKKLLSVELYSHLELDLELLKTIKPSFCSMTSTKTDFSNLDAQRTIALGKKMQDNSVNVIMHVAGRSLKRDEAILLMNKIKETGIKNILALKGASSESDDSECDFPYALEFLRFLREKYGDYFNIATSGYPIGHPTSLDPVKEIGGYLKTKVDSGADFMMCQGVFDLETFKQFYRRCRQEKIEIPILPAVYAVNSYGVLKNLMNFCKVMPEDYVTSMEELQNDSEAINEYSVKYVSDLIRSLLKDEEISIPGVHLYCFNNLTLVKQIFDKLDFEDLKIWQPEE